MFELIFEGEIVPGVALDAVKGNMQQLFKASAEQITAMFSGQKVVLKNKLDKPTALKYQAVLKKNGAVCRIALMAGSVAPTAGAATPPSAPTVAAAPVQAQTQTASPVAATASPLNKSPQPAAAPLGNGLSVAPLPSSFTAKTAPVAAPASVTGHLPLAGEKVENILAGKSISVAPPGTTLGEHREVEPPLFAHLDEIDLAEVGADLSTTEKLPPPPVPDVSHISVAPAGSDMGQIKRSEKAVIPDISHIRLEKGQ
jgi:hypothetical protein